MTKAQKTALEREERIRKAELEKEEKEQKEALDKKKVARADGKADDKKPAAAKAEEKKPAPAAAKAEDKKSAKTELVEEKRPAKAEQKASAENDKKNSKKKSPKAELDKKKPAEEDNTSTSGGSSREEQELSARLSDEEAGTDKLGDRDHAPASGSEVATSSDSKDSKKASKLEKASDSKREREREASPVVDSGNESVSRSKKTEISLRPAGGALSSASSLRPGGGALSSAASMLRPQGQLLGKKTNAGATVMPLAELVRWRFLKGEEAPEEIADMAIVEHTAEPAASSGAKDKWRYDGADKDRSKKDGEADAVDRSIFGANLKGNDKRDRGERGGRREPREQPKLHKSENAYSVASKAELTRDEELNRLCRNSLNKICPENLTTIVSQLSDIDLRTASDLKAFIKILTQKALKESHYCETYADAVWRLKDVFPSFPSDETEGREAGKDVTFTSALLCTCQDEFENNIAGGSMEATEDERSLGEEQCKLAVMARKSRMLAHMKFIGHLFVRSLLQGKVVQAVVRELLEERDGILEDYKIECACELLEATGHTLQSTEKGKTVAAGCFDRLKCIKENASKKNATTKLQKKTIFRIQDLLDLRQNGFQKKLFKEQATTLAEVQRQADSASGPATITTAVVGAQPKYMAVAKAKELERKELTVTVAKKTL